MGCLVNDAIRVFNSNAIVGWAHIGKGEINVNKIGVYACVFFCESVGCGSTIYNDCMIGTWKIVC